MKKHCLKITEDLQISYLERKGDTNGQVLLFVHGFTGDKEIFCHIAWYLPRKFHVILIDLPGHGESKPNDGKTDYRPSVLVESVHQVSFASRNRVSMIHALQSIVLFRNA